MALDGPVHPVSAALDPPHSRAFSAAPAADQGPRQQQELGLASSTLVLDQAKLSGE